MKTAAFVALVSLPFNLWAEEEFSQFVREFYESTAGTPFADMLKDCPAGTIACEQSLDGASWALLPDSVWRRGNFVWVRVHKLGRSIKNPRGFCVASENDIVVAAENGLFGLMGKRHYWLNYEVGPGRLMSADVRAVKPFGDHLAIITDKGLNITDGLSAWQSFSAADGLPVTDLTAIAVAKDGTIWIGSTNGLLRWHNGEWTYFASRRWLPDNHVISLVVMPDGAVWAKTPKGAAKIYTRELTLAQKAKILQETLEARNRRHGFVTRCGVTLQEVSDNDGLWTALYVGSQSFRYAVTKSPEARIQAWRSMRALMRLESVTGISGFPARAMAHESEPQFAGRSERSRPEWHSSSVEDGWWWKGDTSSDEIVGHFFACHVFYALAASEEEKQKIRNSLKRIADHILDHGYYLVDADGRPTTWGVWAPEKLNGDPKWWAERGLGSLEILSHLKVAAHIVGDSRYELAYRELIRKHGYALNTLNTKVPGGVSHDDQLAFLSYYPLLQLEQDPSLRAVYLAGFRRVWEAVRADENPLWNFIYSASVRKPCGIETAWNALQEMPLDFTCWKITNSHRADLKNKNLKKPLSWLERPMHRWSKSPYILDGGDDAGELDQTLFLLPYWLGRYHFR